MLRLIRFPLSLLLFFIPEAICAQTESKNIAPYNLNNIPVVLDKAQKEAKTITIPVNKYEKEGQQAAKETADTFHSPIFQDQIKCQQKRIEKEVFSDFVRPWKKKGQPGTADPKLPGNLAESEKIFLFLSSSIPEATIHNYLADISRINESRLFPVMRGLVQGLDNRKAHTEYFSQLLKTDPSCQDSKASSKTCKRYRVTIKMKPPLFSKFGISQVPALVYENANDAFLVQGDTGLDHLLERINREVKSNTLATLIKKIQGGEQ